MTPPSPALVDGLRDALATDAFFVSQILSAICESDDECSRDRMAARNKAIAVSNALPGLLDELEATRLDRDAWRMTADTVAAAHRAAESRALTAPAGVPDGITAASICDAFGIPRGNAIRIVSVEETPMNEYGQSPVTHGRWLIHLPTAAAQLSAAPPSDAPGEGNPFAVSDAYKEGYHDGRASLPSPAEQGAREDAGITCARCKGSGEGTVQVGVGPDAYDAPVMCEACGGSGAFDGTEPLRAFPTMLRKMWSGGDVQRWIDENIAPAYAAVCTMARRAAPLAAGRVGVADSDVREAVDRAMRDVEPIFGEHFDDWLMRVRDHASARLAGPLVAGEVE